MDGYWIRSPDGQAPMLDWRCMYHAVTSSRPFDVTLNVTLGDRNDASFLSSEEELLPFSAPPRTCQMTTGIFASSLHSYIHGLSPGDEGTRRHPAGTQGFQTKLLLKKSAADKKRVVIGCPKVSAWRVVNNPPTPDRTTEQSR